MKTSTAGLRFLELVEGKRNHYYKDSAGLLTIGIGHMLTETEIETGLIEINDGKYIWKAGAGLNDVLVYALLAQDVKPCELAINLQPVILSQSQFDALVSFVFNVGINAFYGSTLLKRLAENDFRAVPSELRKWNKAGGKFSEGLLNRREKEIRLFEKGLYI